LEVPPTRNRRVLLRIIMIKFFKKIHDYLFKRYHLWYHSKPRKYTYKGVWTIVQPTVFSPFHTYSTKILLNYLSTLDLKGKNVLELGCGSGIISLVCANKKALVTASDINKTALSSLKEIVLKQNLSVKCIASDLFNKIHKKDFDYIIINPPFYAKEALTITEKAWYCGVNFEYFEALFKQLSTHISKNTKALIILSKDCKIDVIFNIAHKNNLRLESLLVNRNIYQTHTIYNILFI